MEELNNKAAAYELWYTPSHTLFQTLSNVMDQELQQPKTQEIQAEELSYSISLHASFQLFQRAMKKMKREIYSPVV